jgi:hypothetical protein
MLKLVIKIIEKNNDGDLDLFYPTYKKSNLNGPKGAVFWW